jgi:hypothetical protein
MWLFLARIKVATGQSRPGPLTAILCFALASCAGYPPLPSPPQGLHARLDPELILIEPGERNLSVQAPVAGGRAGAGVGATQAGVSSVMVGLATCHTGQPVCVITAAAGIVLAAPAALIGAGVGAIRARSPEEVESANANLQAVWLGQRPLAILGERVSVLVQEYNELAVTPGQPKDAPDVSLELALTEYDISAVGEISPSLTLGMGVRGDLVERHSNRLLHRRNWRYESERRNFFDLGAEGGALLRDEFEAAYGRLAEHIVNELFTPGLHEGSDRGEPGRAWTEAAFDFESLAMIAGGAPCGEDLRVFILRIDDERIEAEIQEPGMVALPPGDHVFTVACGNYRTSPSRDEKSCGEIAFQAEVGHDYALRWSLETGRLTLHDLRPDKQAAEGTTWRNKKSWFTNLFSSRLCPRPGPS